MAVSDTVKGFTDFVGKDALKRLKIKRIIEDAFLEFGVEPAETPIIENEEFVTGGNSNDEAVRDVYRLRDRGDRALALRYEFTFQLQRIAKRQKLPYKRFQIGYNFRDEPIKKGRLRQFVQCDCDVIGSTAKDEAELLALASTIFSRLEIPVQIGINNRKLINEILVDFDVAENNREQVIREIDKMDKIPRDKLVNNLSALGAEKLLDVFDGKESAFEKYGSYKEIKNLQILCKSFGIDVIFKPTLMRGLSYYNGTVLEIFNSDIGVSIAGGGAYLFDSVQGFGFALGLEPIMLICPLKGDAPDYLLVSLEQDEVAIVLATKLRGEGNRVQLLLDKTKKRAMEYADSKGIGKVVILGADEVTSGEYSVRDMVSGKEQKVKL
ncbi:MAG: histidyl-tRNA synthetase [Patescibacteria group bacterium]|jgi:histidyl-tRNA synthetase